MSMSDPIADLLTRIRNASRAEHEKVDIPSSKLKLRMAEILKDEGFIKNFRLIEDNKQGMLRLKVYKKAGDGWKIYDVNVLGVWLVENYRNSFAQEIGADLLIYQDLEALKRAIRAVNPKLKEFEASCFDGNYVTGDVTRAYLSRVAEPPAPWGACSPSGTACATSRWTICSRRPTW